MRLKLRECEVDLGSGRVLRGGTEASLTTKERDLLLYLADREGEVVSNEDLLVEVWGYAPTVASRAVANTMSRLRRKVEADPKHPEHLLTSYGGGFRFLPLAAPLGPQGRLLGRERELAWLQRKLDEGARLITLLGIGGIGKTAVAQALLGVRSGLSADLEAVGQEIEASVAAQQGLSPADLIERLRRRGRVVLVLDNAEHLIPLLREPVEGWLAQLPELQIVVTSRLPLGLEAEHRVPIGPLSGEIARELFVSRAIRLDPSLTGEEDLGPLLDRLGGIPLAIELAAARMGTWALADLVEGLDLELLRDETRPGRQASAENTLMWSIAALNEEDRSALTRATGFVGDFGAAAGEHVLGSADALQRLVSLGLLQRLMHGGRARFRVLPLVRMAVLASEGPAAGQRAHAVWLLEAASEAPDAEAFYTEHQSQILSACQQAPPALSATLAAWAGPVILRQGSPEPLRLILERLLPMAELPKEQAAALWILQGRLLIRWERVSEAAAAYDRAEALGADVRVWRFGVLRRTLPLEELNQHVVRDSQVHRHMAAASRNAGRLQEAEQWAQSAVELAPDSTERIASLGLLANVLTHQKRGAEARFFLEQGIDEAGPEDPRSAGLWGNLAADDLRNRRYRRAIEHGGKALQLFRLNGKRTGVVVALHNLACGHLGLGDGERARYFALRSLAEGGGRDPTRAGITTTVLATCYHLCGELDGALEAARRGVAALPEGAARASALRCLARVLAERGEVEEARALAPEDPWTSAWVEGERSELPTWTFPGDHSTWRAAVARAQS